MVHKIYSGSNEVTMLLALDRVIPTLVTSNGSWERAEGLNFFYHSFDERLFYVNTRMEDAQCSTTVERELDILRRSRLLKVLKYLVRNAKYGNVGSIESSDCILDLLQEVDAHQFPTTSHPLYIQQIIKELKGAHDE